MAETFKVLAQSRPDATTVTDAYTVPAATSTVVSSIVIGNTSTAAVACRVSVAVAGAVDAIGQYIYYDLSIPANDTFIATVGLTLAATDKVRVYAGSANLNFHLYGTEIT